MPGIEISELLPKIAQRMKHTAIIRSLNTRIADHGGGASLMELGRRQEPAFNYPDLGAICARELAGPTARCRITSRCTPPPKAGGKGTSGFLGSRFAPMFLSDKMVPENINLPQGLSSADHEARNDLRELLANRFERERSNSVIASHNYAYQRVRGLMASEELFDITKEPQNDARPLRPHAVRRTMPDRPAAGGSRRPVRQSRPRLVGQPRPELRDAPRTVCRPRSRA